MDYHSSYKTVLVSVLIVNLFACSSSVEEVSKKPIEIQPPVSTTNYPSGVYQAISVELYCKPFEGRTCTIYYQEQIDNQPPTPSQQYSGAIALTSVRP